MKREFLSPFRHIVAIAMLLTLSACAGYEITNAINQDIKPLDKNSLRIAWNTTNKFRMDVEKHQRGNGLQKPTITDEENQTFLPKIELLKFNLVHNVVPNVSTSLAPYVSKGANAKFELTLTIRKMVIDTDGRREVIMTAAVHPVTGTGIDWSRTITVAAPVVSSDDAITKNFSDAIVEQMRSSSLVQ